MFVSRGWCNDQKKIADRENERGKKTNRTIVSRCFDVQTLLSEYLDKSLSKRKQTISAYR